MHYYIRLQIERLLGSMCVDILNKYIIFILRIPLLSTKLYAMDMYKYVHFRTETIIVYNHDGKRLPLHANN